MKSSGLRTFFTPRWLGAFGALIVLIVIFVLLGLWQFGVAKDEGNRAAVEEAGSRPRIALTDLTRPHQPFGADFSNREVTVTGTYAAEGTIVVVDRRLGDRSGSWVVTPLVTDFGTVAVLRGFAPGVAGGELLKAPTGQVTVLGTVGPSESPREGPALPAPQVRGVDLSQLVNHWPGDLYNLMVFASSEQPATTTPGGIPPADAAAGLSRVPPPQLSTQLNLKNAAYAIQWWCFGVFAVWLWWKMFRAESEPDEPGPMPPGGGEPRIDPPVPDQPEPSVEPLKEEASA